MKARAVRLAVVVCAAGFGLAAARSAEAQSYPKLMVNGHGLALTRLAIQEKINGQWMASFSLRLGVQYRMIIRLTNFFPGQVDAITNLRYEVRATGALFFPNDAFSGTVALRATGNDKEGLKPRQSKTFYEYFKWNAPTVPTPLATFTFTFSGAELRWLPNASGPVRPGG